MRHTIVTAQDRPAFHARAGLARAHYAKCGCHYWLFEEAHLPGAYLEFFEAGDADTLSRAHQQAPDRVEGAPRVYLEVELI